jgi:hypothetical protein
VRREAGGRLIQRAKLVRAEFVQAINEHWSKRPLGGQSARPGEKRGAVSVGFAMRDVVAAFIAGISRPARPMRKWARVSGQATR